MGLQGVVIEKGQPGANTILGADSTSGLLLTGVAVTGGLQLGTVYTLFQPKDAEDLGVDADYDATNNVRVYRHIKEFYRMAGKGVKLYLMVVAQTVTMAELVEDTGNVYARKLITDADGEIRQLAVGINPPAGYTPTMLDGINADVHASIPLAQSLAEWGYSVFRPFQVILEGRDFGGDAASALDLRNITDTPAEKVSIVIGQDYKYAALQNTIGQAFADIGNFIGSIARIRVNQNPGEVETMNLSDAGKDAFMEAGISSHDNVRDIEADWETLDVKGYIFPVRYVGVSGFRWNDDHVCILEVEDEDGYINESTIAYGRTLDKASRVLRAALLPKVKSVQPVDPETGKLPVGIVKYFEGIGDRAFERMEAAGEISRGKTYVDPDSNLLTGDRTLNVSFVVVPYGTIKEIKGVINLKTSL